MHSDPRQVAAIIGKNFAQMFDNFSHEPIGAGVRHDPTMKHHQTKFFRTFSDVGAAAMAPFDEPVRDQYRERRAHRYTTDREGGREGALGRESTAWRKVTRANRLSQFSLE